jgi:hypothetical protein
MLGREPRRCRAIVFASTRPEDAAMSVAVTCQCNTTFELKDEFAGRMVKCPNCGTANRVPGTKLTPKSQADPVFDRDVFLLRQKAIAIKQKYAVSDEAGQQLLYVERPAHFFKNLMALVAGVVAATIVFVGAAAASSALTNAGSTNAGGIVALVGMIAAWVTVFVVGIGLSKKRHVTFYRDEAKSEKVMEILQFKKFEFFTTTFVVRDAKGQSLARLRKNMFTNLLRKRWWMTSIAGRPIVMAQEDSIILSLLRRLLGPFFGLLRTNFVILDDTGKHVGEFQRKLTILDRYALDMRADANRNVDRRLALALGVVLDTGERR